MFRKITFVILLLGSVVVAESQVRKQSPKTMSLKAEQEASRVLAEDIQAMRHKIQYLESENRRLRTDIDQLNLNLNKIVEEQKVRIEKITAEMVQKKDFIELIDQRFNTLSLALSKTINTFSEKIQNAFNRVISVLNAQQKVLDATIVSSSSQSEEIAHEVKEGETLSRIASEHKTNPESLKSINFIADEDNLLAGQMLFMPRTK
jgi:LysM repeat protein